MKLESYESEQVEQSTETEAGLKAAWVAALRSDKYKQTTGVLRNTRNEYCCLGVLCDIVDKGAWQAIEDEDYYQYGPTKKDGDADVAFLPGYISNLLPGVAYKAGELMRMNDKLDKSFKQIADYIEANVDVAE